jgi:NTP pyrophosphatase (non-canonical NTP hydrolase)
MDIQEVTVAAAVEILSARALDVRRRFADFEQERIGREWTTSEIMSGFVVDVGDLTRLVMAATGARHVDDLHRKIEHELADCLWSLLVLADRLGVDLAQAFEATMQELTNFLEGK